MPQRRNETKWGRICVVIFVAVHNAKTNAAARERPAVLSGRFAAVRVGAVVQLAGNQMCGSLAHLFAAGAAQESTAAASQSEVNAASAAQTPSNGIQCVHWHHHNTCAPYGHHSQ